MKQSDAEQEIDRIEREIEVNSQPPGGPPIKRGGSGGDSGDSNRKNQSLDVVLVGAVLLLGIGATFVLGEMLSRTQKTQLSSGAIGAAAGLLVGYGIGKNKP